MLWRMAVVQLILFYTLETKGGQGVSMKLTGDRLGRQEEAKLGNL